MRGTVVKRLRREVFGTDGSHRTRTYVPKHEPALKVIINQDAIDVNPKLKPMIRNNPTCLTNGLRRLYKISKYTYKNRSRFGEDYI